MICFNEKIESVVFKTNSPDGTQFLRGINAVGLEFDSINSLEMMDCWFVIKIRRVKETAARVRSDVAISQIVGR